MRKTANYGLALYDPEDNFSITASEDSLNNNMELIDEALKDKVALTDLKKYVKSVNNTLPDENGNVTITVTAEQPEFVVKDTVEEALEWLSENGDVSKKYVLPDGYIYTSQLTIIQPLIEYEERTGGFWYGDKWNATGTFTTNPSCCAKRTNVIPVIAGDQFYYKGYTSATPDSVVWLDENQEYISDEKINSPATFTTITVPEGAAYVWFGSFQYTSNIDSVVLEVKWLTCQSAEEIYVWANTGISYAPNGSNEVVSTPDVLANKKIVYDGDSICMGYNAEGGYPSLIASITGGSYDNQGIGGGRLCANDTKHSVVNNLTNLPTDGDLYCFEGGINDYWGNTALGTCTEGDYTSTVDTTTICGAMEEIFRYALTNFVGKPICFIITHKIQKTAHQKNGAGHTFKDYRDAMVNVCEKYSIPYYDAFNESGLNGWNDAQNNAYLTGNSAGTPDGIHPNKEGYKHYYVPQLLALFRSILPIE